MREKEGREGFIRILKLLREINYREMRQTDNEKEGGKRKVY